MFDTNPIFRDSREAFEAAIKSGALSDEPSHPMYAGHFMYMHTTVLPGPDVRATDDFKHVLTREYIHVPTA